jgi:hypothetical protein
MEAGQIIYCVQDGKSWIDYLISPRGTTDWKAITYHLLLLVGAYAMPIGFWLSGSASKWVLLSGLPPHGPAFDTSDLGR